MSQPNLKSSKTSETRFCGECGHPIFDGRECCGVIRGWRDRAEQAEAKYEGSKGPPRTSKNLELAAQAVLIAWVDGKPETHHSERMWALQRALAAEGTIVHVCTDDCTQGPPA